MMSGVFLEMRTIMGDGLFIPLMAFTTIYLVNFGYIHGRGIKKLDAYFENGKDYNDTWTLSATFRFGTYCQEFIRGKLKVEDHNMRWWMYFNALGYILFCVQLGCYVLLSIYLNFLS
ncbi:hypothetical protein [Halodesulfovibrio sp. MK-HDV]|jgi:hypothetical protein|uniref:hypothetical protein n=1 Tax=Halodesulfovibrio sp. MK-HDV TaxID=2599925 RepID=UPI00136ACB9B|nr:hypothetical protein [Halodesulfovibrio sp. MK-HDV]